MDGLSELRVLVRQPPWRWWAVSATSGRLLGTMAVLAYVLVGEAVYDSIALGALIAGVAVVSSGVAAPLVGRRLDRAGLRVGLLRSLWLTTGVLVVQFVAIAVSAPVWVVFVLAGLQGVGYGAAPGAYRALLVPSVAPDDLPRANTVDAVLTEIGFVAGPALAGVVAALGGPLAVMALMVGVVAVAAVVTARLDEVEPAAPGAVSPWRHRDARYVYAVCLAVGASLGLLESAVAARAVELGLPAPSAGPLLALTAFGSGAAGLAVSLLEDQRGRIARRALLALSTLAAALGLAAAAPTPVLLAVTMVLVGIPIAPLNAMGTQRLQDTLERRQLGEGFALYSALILVGAGSGNLLTGRLLDSLGAPMLLTLSAGIPAAVAAVVAAHAAAGRHRPVAVPGNEGADDLV